MSAGRSVANDGVQIALHFWMVIQNETHFWQKVLSLKTGGAAENNPDGGCFRQAFHVDGYLLGI